MGIPHTALLSGTEKLTEKKLETKKNDPSLLNTICTIHTLIMSMSMTVFGYRDFILFDVLVSMQQSRTILFAFCI